MFEYLVVGHCLLYFNTTLVQIGLSAEKSLQTFHNMRMQFLVNVNSKLGSQCQMLVGTMNLQ